MGPGSMLLAAERRIEYDIYVRDFPRVTRGERISHVSHVLHVANV